MTIEITDEMRKVAGDAVHDHLYDKPAPDYASPTGDDFQDIGLAALTAALPIIEKQVREQCERDLQECLPVELWNTAIDENGWLSDGHENTDGTGTGDNVTYCGEGSIDLHHIASLAARIVREGK